MRWRRRASMSPPSSPTARACRCTTSPMTLIRWSAATNPSGAPRRAGAVLHRRYHRDWRYVAGWGRGWCGTGNAGAPRTRWRHGPDPQRLPPDGCARRQPQGYQKLASAGTVGGGVSDRALIAGTRPPPTNGMQIRGCSTRRAVWSISQRPDAPARARRPDDQDHHSHAQRRLPDLEAVHRRGHGRRRDCSPICSGWSATR